MNEPNFVVDRETAENEFDRFIDINEIDLGDEDIGAEDQKDITRSKRRMIAAIMEGRMAVDSEGCIEFTLSDGQELKFKQPTGEAYSAMDTRKSGHDIAKAYASMAAMTGRSPVLFNKMKFRDLKICFDVWSLFLQM